MTTHAPKTRKKKAHAIVELRLRKKDRKRLKQALRPFDVFGLLRR